MNQKKLMMGIRTLTDDVTHSIIDRRIPAAPMHAAFIEIQIANSCGDILETDGFFAFWPRSSGECFGRHHKIKGYL